MSTTVTLDTIHQRVLRGLWPNARALIETTTGAGSTTSLVIASRANSSQSTSAFDGVGVYCPSVTTAPKESYVTRGGFTVASGTYTMSPAFGSSPGSAASVYFLYGLTMNEIDEAINEVIRKTYLPRYQVLSAIHDGAMEDAGSDVTTDWPDATGTPTQTKETTIVLTGTKSLKLVIATLDDSVRSQSLPVTENDQIQFFSAIKCTAGSLRAQLYDVTNSAEIDGATVNEEDWTEVRLLGNAIPADCQNLQVRYIAKTASTTAYVDYAALYTTRNTYDLPSQIADTSNVFAMAYLPVGRVSEVANSYVGMSEVMEPWQFYTSLRDYAGVNSLRVQLDQPFNDPLFFHYRVPDAVMAQNTSDTDTTFVPVEVVVAGALAECHERLGHDRQARIYRHAYNDQLEAIGLGRPVIRRSPQRRVMAV